MIKKLIFFTLLAVFVTADQRLEKLIIAGPIANVSHPILHMIESGALDDVAKEVEFKVWQNPDELRAMIASKSVDISAIPTNVAALLHNRGVDLKLIGVSVWGILQIVSRDKSIAKIEDLKGKKLAVPFRHDMPDLLLSEIIKKAGLEKNDIEIVYFPTPPDAMQNLILRRVDHALLAEPATSMALRKTKSFPVSLVAPDLYRVIDIQNEWGRVNKSEPKVPQAAVAAFGKISADQRVVTRFWQEYKKSIEWYKNNPEEAGKLVAKRIKMLNADAVMDSVSHIVFDPVVTEDAKGHLEQFFQMLYETNPKIIGSKLPDQSFYRR